MSNPNLKDQVTSDDFCAPEGSHRIICEDMKDGFLKVVGDIHDVGWADEIYIFLTTEKDQNGRFNFLMFDDQGKAPA